MHIDAKEARLPRSRRAARTLIASATAVAALLGGAPLAAHAESGYEVEVGVLRSTLTIPYGGVAPTQRILVGTDDYRYGAGPVTANVYLVDPAGASSTLASALPIGGVGGSYGFPSGPYTSRSATVSVPAESLGQPGRYIVRVRAIDGAGAEDGFGDETAFTVNAATPPAVTSLVARASVRTVFPTKDGYRDTMTFVVRGATTGTNVQATGTATLKRGRHTVKTWSLRNATSTLQWNGRDDGRIVPGRYTMTATLSGQAGTAQSGTASVTVDSRALEARTVTTTYSASSVLGDRFYDLSGSHDGDCFNDQLSSTSGRVAGANYCMSRDYLRGTAGDYIALYVPGSVALPAVVRAAQSYGGTSVTVGQHTTVESGHAYMYLNAAGHHLRERVYDGYYTHTLKWSGRASRLFITFDLGSYARAGVRDYTATWHYRVLR